MATINYSLYLLLGVLPSFIWLFYYLRKDIHPEPKLLVLKIFFYGMLVALPAFFIELGFQEVIRGFNLPLKISKTINVFLGVAFVEESLKYLVVREKVFKHPEFNESIDAMLYMIIAALGFAATENILILFKIGSQFLLSQTLLVLIIRFFGATFLHALASGMVGFQIAFSFLKYQRERFGEIGAALLFAAFLHGLFNLFIIKGGENILAPILVLLFLAVYVTLGLKRLKRLTI
ncbi:PrsW family intramembrane metalloprotease [bacterium]|nr:PrsW family intramembrane metalloprotease [bacterium]